jgi:hypothetical protein
MRDTGRTLLFAVVVAAVLGFAAGWFARARLYPTPRERAERAAEEFRRGLEDLGGR